MLKFLFSAKEIGRILGKNKKNKQILEKVLNIKLRIYRDSVSIESRKDAFDEYIVSKIIEAMALGFDIFLALKLKDIDYELKKIDIKLYVKPSRLNIVKGRIIGQKGKTKKVIERLSECKIILSDHIVAIIGKIKNVEMTYQAIITLIRGSPQSKVYALLERSHERIQLDEEEIEEMLK